MFFVHLYRKSIILCLSSSKLFILLILYTFLKNKIVISFIVKIYDNRLNIVLIVAIIPKRINPYLLCKAVMLNVIEFGSTFIKINQYLVNNINNIKNISVINIGGIH